MMKNILTEEQMKVKENLDEKLQQENTIDRKITGRLMIQFGNNQPTELKKIFNYEKVDLGMKQSPILNDESQKNYNRKTYYDSNKNSVTFFILNENTDEKNKSCDEIKQSDEYISMRHKNTFKNTFPDIEIQKETEPQSQLEELDDYLIMLAEMPNIGVRRKLILLEGYINKIKNKK